MDKREFIVKTAACLIHEHGYNNVGIKSILEKVSIPKGSFYYYFKSKEELGLAVIDYYINDIILLTSNADKSIQGIYNLFNLLFKRFINNQLKKGCPIGNLILELADKNECFRLKLLQWYRVLECYIEGILINNNIKSSHNKAKAIIAAFEGTVLLAKLDKDISHVEAFNNYMFKAILNS